MDEKIRKASEKGEGLAKEYNSDTHIPFPFEKIVSGFSDLEIFLADLSDINEGESISGLIQFKEKEKKFEILIDKNKPKNRQYFTAAHELGHYFLHKEQLKEKSLVVDGDSTLLRSDSGLTNTEETQANSFAASLLMPQERVEVVWKKVEDIKECADFFNVSVSAMSIRLEVLNLV